MFKTILSLELGVPLTRAEEKELAVLIGTDEARSESVCGFDFVEKRRELNIKLSSVDRRGLHVPPCIDSFLKDNNINYDHPRLLQKAA